MNEKLQIQSKDRDAIIQSLRAGVVPRRGLQHIQVGRKKELEALIGDIQRVGEGGAAIRLVIGDYGAGKTFFLHLVRSVAQEKKLVTAQADLNPDRRLHASGGQARSLYAELMRNIATRAKPEGGALASVVERFVGQVLSEAQNSGQPPDVLIHQHLECLTEMVGGYDFAHVIAAYWRGHDSGNDAMKADAVRWLRGEFSTKTDAKSALGVRTIIDDGNFYDHLKLFARFTRLAGYHGLVICLDEMVNLYKLASAQARNANYEQILRIINDCLQGSAEGLGFLMAGTPDFLLDPRRGLYSYPALQSRLGQNPYVKDGLVDFSGPILRLTNLTPEDLYVLLFKLRDIFAWGNHEKHLIPDEALKAFMDHCANRIGEAYFRTPRTTIVAFLNLLAILDQNPDTTWQAVLGALQIEKDSGPESDLLPSPDNGAHQTEDAGTSESGNAGPAESKDDELSRLRL